MDSPSSPGREGVKQEGRGSQIVRQVESVQTPNSLLVLHIFSIPFRIGMMNDFQCPGDGLIRSFLPIVPWFPQLDTQKPMRWSLVQGIEIPERFVLKTSFPARDLDEMDRNWDLAWKRTRSSGKKMVETSWILHVASEPTVRPKLSNVNNGKQWYYDIDSCLLLKILEAPKVVVPSAWIDSYSMLYIYIIYVCVHSSVNPEIWWNVSRSKIAEEWRRETKQLAKNSQRSEPDSTG